MNRKSVSRRRQKSEAGGGMVTALPPHTRTPSVVNNVAVHQVALFDFAVPKVGRGLGARLLLVWKKE